MTEEDMSAWDELRDYEAAQHTHHQADDATVERVARALCEARGLSPDTLYEHHEWEKWPVDERREYVDAITGEQRVSLMHRGWRKRVPDAAAAIAAMREDG